MTAAAPALPSSSPRLLKAGISITFLFGFLMFGGGLVITVIQAFYSFHYLQGVFTNAGVDALKAVALRIPAWSRPFMVDLALVAPGLIGFTGACITIGAGRLLWRKKVSYTLETFPFPRPYRTYYIQHGLLGAVFGFVIGFWNLDPQSSQASTVLLAALGAALWSTLTAIGLAYFLCPIIEWHFQRLLLPAPTAGTDEDPLLILDQRASDAATALERLTSAASAVDEALTLRTLHDEVLAARRDQAVAEAKLISAESRIDSGEKNLIHANSLIHALRTAADEKGEQIKELQIQAKSLTKQIETSTIRHQGDLDLLRQHVDEMKQDFTSDRQRRQDTLSRAVKTGAAFIERLQRSLDQ